MAEMIKRGDLVKLTPTGIMNRKEEMVNRRGMVADVAYEKNEAKVLWVGEDHIWTERLGYLMVTKNYFQKPDPEYLKELSETSITGP